MKINLKFLLKKSLYIVAVSSAVASTYLFYFFTVGIPKTQARNYFNLAIRNIEDNEIERAELNLKTAQTFWSEEYIQDKLEEVNQLKTGNP